MFFFLITGKARSLYVVFEKLHELVPEFSPTCHDTVSRLVVVYCIGSGGHLYILSNLAVYRSPHSIGPFEYEVSAWRPLIGQTLVCVFARFARCP